MYEIDVLYEIQYEIAPVVYEIGMVAYEIGAVRDSYGSGGRQFGRRYI